MGKESAKIMLDIDFIAATFIFGEPCGTHFNELRRCRSSVRSRVRAERVWI